MHFRFLDTLAQAKEHYHAMRVDICGIEIGGDSRVIFDRRVETQLVEPGSERASPWPFKGDTAFMLGNEGSGMSDQQRGICDFLTYIPQYSGATASLNVMSFFCVCLQPCGNDEMLTFINRCSWPGR